MEVKLCIALCFAYITYVSMHSAHSIQCWNTSFAMEISIEMCLFCFFIDYVQLINVFYVYKIGTSSAYKFPIHDSNQSINDSAQLSSAPLN